MLAVTERGPAMVTVVEALALSATGPAQAVKTYPVAGAALMFTTVPAAYQPPEGGVIVPRLGGATAVVSWYSVPKLAVYVVAADGTVTVWERAPLSDQEEKTYRVPVVPAWGDVVAMVWLLPGTQVKVWALV